MTSRRDFVLALGASALAPSIACAKTRSADARAAGAAASTVTAKAGARALSAVGVQLYMLRAQMRENPEATLARIGELEYGEIEWWGSWGRTPAQLRALLDQHRLRSPSGHVGLAQLLPDRLPDMLEAAGTMGQQSLIVASTQPEQRRTTDDWKRIAGMLNTAGASAASVGVRTGYHNHDYEFQRFGDRTGFEILIAETDARYVDIELDCYWAFKAGHDPLALLRAHPDRIRYLHVKDSAGAPTHEQRDVGDGVMEWKPLLEYALSQKVTSIFVEHDGPKDPWATARNSRAYLASLGY